MSPEFLQTLYEKVVRYYYMPTLSTSGNGRFSKDITSDRAFKAIEHCQTWHNQILYYDKQTRASMMSKMGGLVANIDKKDLEQTAWRMLTNLRQWARSNYDQKQEEILAKEFLDAVKSGNTDRLRTLVKLCDLQNVPLPAQRSASWASGFLQRNKSASWQDRKIIAQR